MPQERTLVTETHGRYLIEPGKGGAGLLVGFHGYAESAEHELQRLASIPGAEHWTRVSVQALHRFYRGRTSEVVASWMTTEDRDTAIADNLTYVRRVIEQVKAPREPAEVVFDGFSQGAAMAYRSACSFAQRVLGVIALAGDVPPELDEVALGRIPAVLIGRGVRDEWYSEEKLDADEVRLRAAGVRLRIFRFDGGHEWTEEFADAAARFLGEIISKTAL